MIFRKKIKNYIASKTAIHSKGDQLIEIFSICYRLATIYFDEHDYEAAIKDLKEASVIDDRNLKVCIEGRALRNFILRIADSNDVSQSLSQFRTIRSL